MTADKILGPAWFLDLLVISSLNEVPPKVLVGPRWHSQIDDAIPTALATLWSKDAP